MVDFPLTAPLEPGWSNDQAVRIEEPETEPPAEQLAFVAGSSNDRASRAEPEAPVADNPMEIGWSNARAVRNEEA